MASSSNIVQFILILAFGILVALSITGVILYAAQYSSPSKNEADGPDTPKASPSTLTYTNECNRRYHTPSELDTAAIDSCVCVCSASMGCDTPVPVGELSPGLMVYYQSTREGDRLKWYQSSFYAGNDVDQSSYPKLSVNVNASQRYQEIIGFGCAFTDSAGINIKSLSLLSQQLLMEAYFGEKGTNYTLCRVPIASSDFSTRAYSYDELEGDFAMANFSLAPEDYELKIPVIRQAFRVSSRPHRTLNFRLSRGRLKLFAAPWSAPGWMKTSGDIAGGGTLKGDFNGDYYRAYALYFRRFFEEYWKVASVKFWAMSVQNEPGNGADLTWRYQSTYWNASMERDFIAEVLGREMKRSTPTEFLQFFGFDHNRDALWPFAVDAYNTTSEYQMSGMGVHWYEFGNYTVLRDVHNAYPDKFLVSTEACAGWLYSQEFPLLGDWNRAEQYAHDILNTLRNWVIGWVDWNLALNERGGPNWVLNFVDAAVIVNATADEFYKQPMYYVLSHFSRFVPPGSTRIASWIDGFANASVAEDQQQVESVAFTTPEGNRVLILVNRDRENLYEVAVREMGKRKKKRGRSAIIKLPANSIITALWKSDQ